MFFRDYLIIAAYLLSLNAILSSSTINEWCGEMSFTATSGIVRHSGQVRSGYSRSPMICVYRVIVGQNNSVSIRFLNVSFMNADRFCRNGWLMISCSLENGIEAITESSSRICHEPKWTTELRLNDCPVLLINSYTGSSISYRRYSTWFQLKYEIHSAPTNDSISADYLPEIDCGQMTFTNRSGIISLPSSNNISLAKVNCTYTIEAETPNARRGLGSMSLDVSLFDLLTLTDSLDACDQDHLQINCTDTAGNLRTVWGCDKYYIDELDDCIKLEIILHSDSYDPRQIRQISYSITTPEDSADDYEEEEEEEAKEYYDYDIVDRDCGNIAYTSPSGIVTSPGFPLPHMHSLNCIYRISVGQNNVVSLKFLEFHLESSSANEECAWDWLKIACSVSEMRVTRQLPYVFETEKFCGEIRWTSTLRYSNCTSLVLTFHTDSSVAKEGFKIQYSVTPKNTSTSIDDEVFCGRTDFAEKIGNITLPNNPSGYLMTINCTYNIYANSTSYILLDLTLTRLSNITESLRECNYKRYRIACVDGPNGWSYDLCKTNSPQPMFSKCRQVQLWLYTKYFDTQEIYQIPFKVIASDEICGTTHFTASDGIISSPNFPLYYPPGANCTYSIAGGVNTAIAIKFLIFHLEELESCEDWILMTCLQSNYESPYENRKFCGSLTWSTAIWFFNCSTLLLNFYSNLTFGNNRFSLNYTISTSVTENPKELPPEISCGVTIFTADSGSINLPHNASLPLATLNCTYTVRTSAIANKGHILFNFGNFGGVFSDSTDFAQHYLMIACMSEKATAEINSTEFLRYSWNELRGIRSFNYTDCDSIQLSLSSSAYYPRRTQYISYSITSTDCGATEFSSSTGFVKSPRYPLSYPHQMHCIYSIAAGKNKTVSLTSLSFYLEGRASSLHGYDSCPHDYLIIRCTGGTETSRHLDEDWYDEYGYGYLYMNPSSASNRLYLNRHLCGIQHIQMTMQNCEAVTLEFLSDRSISYSGFNIQYRIQSISQQPDNNNCGNQTFRNSAGVITSSDFTGRINCTYNIEAGRNKSVLLQLTFPADYSRFSYLTHYHYRHGDCAYTWLQISCLPESGTAINPLKNRKICRSPLENTTLSGCEYVSLHFWSSTRASFRINYMVSESSLADTDTCGNQSFSNLTGVITSPRFPSVYPPGLNCMYYIDVGIYNSLSLEFHTFHLESFHTSYDYSSGSLTTCRYDWVEMSCASGELVAKGDILNNKLCGHKTTVFKKSVTGCRRIALQFVSDLTISHDGFKIHYRILRAGEECGHQVLSELTGIVSSPNYPSLYPDYLNCTNYIEIGGPSNSIFLQFLAFVLEGISNVCHDWVEIRCASNETDVTSDILNKRLCGIKPPFNRTLTGCQRLALEFITDSTISYSGFQIQYTIFDAEKVCGLVSFTEPVGNITFPKPLPNYITEFNCSYSIYAGNYSIISLSILSFTDTTAEEETCPGDWMLIFCHGKELKESHKIVHNSCNQSETKTSLVFHNCSAVNIIFHSENVDTGRFFSISYMLDFKDDIFGATTSAKVVRSKSFGLITAIIAVLIVAFLIVLTVFYLRKKYVKPKEDNVVLLAEDEKLENSESQIITTRKGSSFFVHFQPNQDSC